MDRVITDGFGGRIVIKVIDGEHSLQMSFSVDEWGKKTAAELELDWQLLENKVRAASAPVDPEEVKNAPRRNRYNRR